MSVITMAHGAGGRASRRLFQDLFLKHFNDTILLNADDAADIHLDSSEICFTTDSYTIQPLFFPGGNIGKLAVCGTVNDLAVNASLPAYMSCAFIIEEGFLLNDLEQIVASMAEYARKTGIRIVTGDTKVVERKAADGLFINTTGIGIRLKGMSSPDISSIMPGDIILLTGSIGEHGVSVLGKRKGLEFQSSILSDCRPLASPLNHLIRMVPGIRFMRDPTRGGVATVLNEISMASGKSIRIEEEKIPVLPEVEAACGLLGLEPLYIANEGKAVIVIDSATAGQALDILKQYEETATACIIGSVTGPGHTVTMLTRYGTERLVTMLEGDPLPRIC